MPFGYNSAPAHFQTTIQAILNAPLLSRRPRYTTYVNDAHLAGCTVADVWYDTLKAIRRLTHRGLLINAWKLQLLMWRVSILGYELVRDVFQLGQKSLGKLFGSELPTNDRELL